MHLSLPLLASLSTPQPRVVISDVIQWLDTHVQNTSKVFRYVKSKIFISTLAHEDSGGGSHSHLSQIIPHGSHLHPLHCLPSSCPSTWPWQESSQLRACFPPGTFFPQTGTQATTAAYSSLCLNITFTRKLFLTASKILILSSILFYPYPQQYLTLLLFWTKYSISYLYTHKCFKNDCFFKKNNPNTFIT